MKSLKILLVHAGHNTVGAHSNFVPINIGYIASFLKKTTYEMDFDFKKISNLNNELKMINRKDKRRAFNRYLMQYMNKGSYIFEKNFHKIN